MVGVKNPWWLLIENFSLHGGFTHKNIKGLMEQSLNMLQVCFKTFVHLLIATSLKNKIVYIFVVGLVATNVVV